MGFRSFLRDLLTLYLGYQVIKSYLFGEFSFSIILLLVTVVLMVFTLWFLFEKLGLV